MLHPLRTFHLALWLAALAALPAGLAGCGPEEEVPQDAVGEEGEVSEAGKGRWKRDAGANGDSGVGTVADAGTGVRDAGTVADAGTGVRDAGTTADAGTGVRDAGTTADAGTGVRDAGTVVDAGPGPSAGQLDADGVVMLFPPNTAGASWRLGAQDPNAVSATYFDVGGAAPTRVTEGALTFWTTTGEVVTYSSGIPDGRTARLYVRAAGGTQQYGWNSGALQYGYLASPRDLKNFEATVYVRVRGNLGSHISMSWQLRGGVHSGTRPDFASCTGMQIPYTGQTAKAFREYHHPDYEYVYPTPRFSFTFREGQWLATKAVTWNVPGGTMNQLYLDTDPFDAQGRPRNNFRLYLEWNDRDGLDTGAYTRAATWGGWQVGFRVDGWRNLDFAIVSAREIVPPQ